MKSIAVKGVYLTVVSLMIVLAFADHLSSEALSEVSSPAASANACSPCGAPCTDVDASISDK